MIQIVKSTVQQPMDSEDPEKVLLPVLAALPAQQEELPDVQPQEDLFLKNMRSWPILLLHLILKDLVLTSSRSGRPRLQPITKLLVIRPIATWPAWSRMLANLNGKSMR